MAADAVKWSCVRCEVSVSRIDGEPAMLPTCWSSSDGQVLCLSCSRARAGEAAVDSAPAAASRQDRMRMRRTALIEFEIDRAPEAANRTIALACRTSAAAVASVRDGLERSAADASDPGAPSVA